MAEEELEALRKQRLAELQAKHGVPSVHRGTSTLSELTVPGRGWTLDTNPVDKTPKKRLSHKERERNVEAEMRNSILAQVLDQSARARLSNLALVKPEKTKAVENYLIQMARYGQLSGKVSEQGLIEILEKVSQQTEKKTTVKFNRRKVMDSDEDDDY
ncbi:Programmed cell death protein 5 [Camelus dromedarius]|uniref:Programmed cell death protein 5 n=1 Tax=Camelus dromedarius TaxID=9838 RepID=A0A5N4DSD7_CAMDR|nr:Programmed cell death protein 5 [Camelus dromedarius]